jgi:enoyl-CoA hydratase
VPSNDVLVDVADGIATVTLNRPDKLNALSVAMQQQLADLLWAADRNPDVRVVLLRGRGRSFCSGYDLTDSYATPEGRAGGFSPTAQRSVDEDASRLERAQALLMTLFDMHKPVVAQVHGHCLAGGTGLALLCDMVIVADDATIGFPPARNLGTLPINLWLYHVGPQWAKRLTLTGDTISGTEAAHLGFALKSVPAAVLASEAEGLCSRLAAIDADLLSANKRVVNLGMELMGARTLQRQAAERDASAHTAAAAAEFRRNVNDLGLGAALAARDTAFGDGRARVVGPELRDEQGRLVDTDVRAAHDSGSQDGAR